MRLLSGGAKHQSPRSFSLVTTTTPHHRGCRLLSSAATKTDDDTTTTDSWEDRFKRKHVINAWSSDDISPLMTAATADHTNKGYNELLAVDKSTRYVIHLLYDLSLNISYDWSNAERATALRCHVALQRLADVNMQLHHQTELLSGSIGLRAYEILQGMELFYGQTADERMVLPHPTAATYLMVLRLLAKDPLLASPHLAQVVVERMQQRYDELPGQLELQPNVVHWNQVLSAWAISSTEEEKSFHAANLLQRLKQREIADASSYSHVLRACARSDMSPKGKKLGAEVAIKVYNDMKSRTDLKPNSYLFTFLLQACAYISDPDRRNKISENAFMDCRTDGCVNSHVLAAFQSAVSPEFFQRTMNRGTDRLGGDDGRDVAISTLLKRLPKNDYRNATMKNEFGW